MFSNIHNDLVHSATLTNLAIFSKIFIGVFENLIDIFKFHTQNTPVAKLFEKNNETYQECYGWLGQN